MRRYELLKQLSNYMMEFGLLSESPRMAEESKQPDQAQFAYPAATAADTVKVKKRDQQAATDWQDGEPEKSPLGKPQTIPVDAQGPPVVAPHAQVYGSRQAVPTQEYVAGQNFPDRKSTRLNSSHVEISYAVFCLKK